MFEDRRVTGDRRKHHNPMAIPASGCRRRLERRDPFRQYHTGPWWLQTNYAEELHPLIPEHETQANTGTKNPNIAGRAAAIKEPNQNRRH